MACANRRVSTAPAANQQEKRADMNNSVADSAVRDPVIQLVTFRLKEETYGINVMQVQEVLRVSEIAPVPGAPSYVLGIINLRGNVVTVIDTRSRFGLPPKEIDESSRIVIIESDKQVVGIMVDSVAEVVDLRTTEVDSAPNVGNEESSRYIQGVASRDDDLLILVDLNKLLSDEEWAEVGMF
jgi:purine-binding chemotaxis protein CheW